MSYRNPTSEELKDPLWNRIWNEIKSRDINVPAEYSGYSGATGNHVCMIYDAVRAELALNQAAILREAADRVEHLQFTYDGTSPRQEAVAAILAITTDQPALDRALAEVKRKERLATRLEIAELVHSTILQNRDIALHDILTELWKDVLNTEKPVAQLRAEKGAKP